MGKQDERSGMTRVELSEAEWKQRAENLAHLENERTKLEDKKSTHNREWNEQLKQLDTDIKVAAEEVETHMAWVPAQADMFGANDNEAAEDEEPAEETPRRRRRRRAAAGAEPADVIEA